MGTFGISRATGRRSVPRAQAPLVAVLATAAGDHPVALLDISRTGARLGGQFLPKTGDQLSFKAEAVEARGEVVWSTTNKCAIEFESPIAAKEVQHLRQIAAA